MLTRASDRKQPPVSSRSYKREQSTLTLDAPFLKLRELSRYGVLTKVNACLVGFGN